MLPAGVHIQLILMSTAHSSGSPTEPGRALGDTIAILPTIDPARFALSASGSGTCGGQERHTAHALTRTCPLSTSTVPDAQIWSAFTHECSGWLLSNVTFSRS